MKHEIKQYVFMAYGWDESHTTQGWRPEIWRWEASENENLIFISASMFAVEIPDDFDPVPKQVAVLLDERRAAMDEYQQKVAEINERLSKLQAIEYTP